MKYLKILLTLSVLLIALLYCDQLAKQEQNWTHFVRIGGHGLNINRVDSIIEGAIDTHIFGIETDNDITGRYDSFLDPTEKLEAIKAMADAAHEAGNYAFVYIAGTECITSNADEREHTFFKDHPDWVQRNREGEPAVFGGGTAFWIGRGDEDVWISPFAKEWRKIYMERVRQIAATGIDGVYVDIPYWMTHFRGWTDTWASFDDHTVAAFKEATGVDARTDFDLGDFEDPDFIKWVDFRITALTDFMAEIDENVKSVNPECMTIPEIYPGIEESAVRVGSDVYEMYEVVDVIAHEYSGGGGNAARKNPADWFSYMTGMYTFRAFAEDKASWMLSYSWDGDENVDPKEAMKNLALAQVMAGTNTWDARGHVMSGSNDMETRKSIFKWIADNETTLYSPRKPLYPIGVYFSPKTRNYFADEFMEAYKGVMYLMLQSHLEFQIVTPRTLETFRGQGLILPEVKCISNEEMKFLRQFLTGGNFLIATGETGKYDTSRNPHGENPVHTLLGIENPDNATTSIATEKFSYLPGCPGARYYEEIRRSYNESAWSGDAGGAEFAAQLAEFQSILEQFGYEAAVAIDASPFVATQIARVQGKPHVFIANFKGLKGGENSVQLPERGAKIHFPGKLNSKVYALTYLGELQELECVWESGKLVCTLPDIDRGMVVWYE